MINNHSRATTAGTRERVASSRGPTVGDGRIKDDCQRQRRKEHPYRSFNRYNNLIGTRHIKLRPGCRLNGLRVIT